MQNKFHTNVLENHSLCFLSPARCRNCSNKFAVKSRRSYDEGITWINKSLFLEIIAHTFHSENE